MSHRSLLLVAAAGVFALHPGPLHAQAARTDCNTSGNPLDCAFTPEPPSSNIRLTAALGALLQQRFADKPAARQAWSQARSDNTRLAAQAAKANYNAMTALLERLVADTSAPAHAELNGDLNLDFSLIGDVEARYEEENAETGRRREALTRMSFSGEPGKEGTFRLDEDGEILFHGKSAWTYRARMQYEPESSLFYQTEETIPRLPDAPPAYEAAALINGTAFSAPMPSKRRFETKVAPGAVYPSMLGLTISAMKGELPASFTIWIVNEQGEVVPAEISVVRELTVQEPVGPAAGGCAEANGIDEPRRAVELQVSAGALSHSRIVLADAPHLKVSDGLKCRVVR